MRVALLSRSAHPLHPPGGMERAVFYLAKHLSAKGANVTLFTRPALQEGDFPAEVVAVPYRSLGAGGHGRVLDRTLNYPRFAMALGRAVAERVGAGRIDVVDAQGLTALGYGRLRREDASLRAPLVMNPQGMEEHKTRGLKRLALTRVRALSREAARLSDRVIATDEATRDEVPRLLGIAASRVAVLPNGIDPEEIRSLTPVDARAVACGAVRPLARAAPLFLSVGRLEAYKGFGDVLEALAERHAAGALPSGWAWVVVGEGSKGGPLGARARVRGIGDHVHLPGRLSDRVLHALYASADVFAHATRYEGSSLVTLEAMAHGLPVVATRAGGIPDKVVDGQTGCLVEPGDVAALGRALQALAADAALRRAMGERGRQRALDCFAWPVLVDRCLALYEELLRARPA